MNGNENIQLDISHYKISSASKFLKLTEAEVAYINLKLILLNSYRKWREKKKVSLASLAEQLELSESSLVEMEKGNPSVSLDLLIQSLLTLGVTTKHLAQIIASLDETTSDL